MSDDSDDEIVDLTQVRGASHPAFQSSGAEEEPQDGSRSTERLLTHLRATSGSGLTSNKITDRENEYQKRRFDRGVDVATKDESFKDRMQKVMQDRELEEKMLPPAPPIDQKDSETASPAADRPRKRRRRRWDDAGNASASATEHDLSSDAEAKKYPLTRKRRWDEEGAAAMGEEKEKNDETTQIAWTPEQLQRMRIQREIAQRNKPFTDEELDKLLPKEGFKIVPPPADYKPIKRNTLLEAPEMEGSQFSMGTGDDVGGMAGPAPAQVLDGMELYAPDGTALPMLKPEDVQYFGKLAEEKDESTMDKEEIKERQILRLILRIKNGTPRERKSALRNITTNAREFGAGPLFNQILPLLLSPTLEDHERHLLVKVIDRILYRLDDLVRPYVHKILVVIEPMLIDKDYYAQIEGREIIANLAKAAGLPTMIATMRPDIDHVDDFVRNTTARAFAVVASALGIPTILPFIKAVSQSRKSWQARHTGIKIVQHISILMGCAVLPHLTGLVKIVEHGLVDPQHKVRLQTALSLASLAESAHPYGLESFESVLEPLWKGIRQHHGKVLAAYLKAIGFIIPLMDDDEYASYFTRQVMAILIREFRTQDEEMRKIVLKVVEQCVSTDGVQATYIRQEVCPDFFKCFWIRRMALDRRNYRQLVATTVAIAKRVGGAEVIEKIVNDLKDENEPYRRMVMEAVTKILQSLGAVDINLELEQRMVDGALFAFQEQGAAAVAAASAKARAEAAGFNSGESSASNTLERETAVILNGFGVIVNSLGLRAKPYIPQICGTIKFRLHNKDPQVRLQAADLVARIANVMKVCDEEELMGHLGVVLYEYLGEEFPEVLGSILGALSSIVNVIGMSKMTPPIKDLLPRLTPVLKNRHEKVQENCINLVGRVADRGAEFVSAREWMRICFELIELLTAKRKSIRRASVSTFGFIAKAIGPQDVIHTLLNNLKVQDRQMRVCTTVAIAIVAEGCGPFAVLPALLNEYRVTDVNVQNGVLKALSFLFEYIGEMGKDYIYSVVSLLEDALTDRDAVHRQTASSVVKHMSLGVQGLGCEDALTHLINFVWPNIFETSPHVIAAVFDAIEGLRVSLGPQRVLLYVLAGLFHPARRVREVFWRIYNNLYVYANDGLVPAYPRLPDDYVLDPNEARREKLQVGERKLQILDVMSKPKSQRVVRNCYQRTHLDLFI